jgi:SCY1-like protein 1
VHALDSYQLFLFLQVLFNGPLPFMSSPSEVPTARGQIPPSVFPHARRLFTPNGNPNARLKASTFHALGYQESPPGFFKSNRLVNLAESLDSFALASELERASLMIRIKEGLQGGADCSKLSDEFAKWKVLPAVTKALEFGPGGPQLLPLILSIGENANLTPAEYDKYIAQAVMKAFASPDRAMRLALLEAMPTFVEKLDQRQITDKVWPHLVRSLSQWQVLS